MTQEEFNKILKKTVDERVIYIKHSSIYNHNYTKRIDSYNITHN